MLAQELHRSFTGKLGRFGMVAAALVAVETVAGFVIVRHRLWMRRRDFLRRLERDRMVRFSPVEHHRAFRMFADQIRNRTAIIGHRAGKTRDPRGGHPRHRAAVAVTHDADLAPRLPALYP